MGPPWILLLLPSPTGRPHPVPWSGRAPQNLADLEDLIPHWDPPERAHVVPMNCRPLFLTWLAAACVAAIGGPASTAAPPAEPRFELFSSGPASTALLI